MISTLEILDARHDITTLKHRYVRAVEERDWDSWADCFTEGATAQFMPAPGETQNEVHSTRAELREWLPHALKNIYAVIRVSMPDIEILDAKRARGDWAQIERLLVMDGPLREATYYGYYHETYEKTDDGRWRIASLKMSRIRHDSIDSEGRSEFQSDLANRPARTEE